MGKKHLKKILIVLFIIIVVVAFKIFHLYQYLTLSYIKASQERFAALYAAEKLSL